MRKILQFGQEVRFAKKVELMRIDAFCTKVLLTLVDQKIAVQIKQ